MVAEIQGAQATIDEMQEKIAHIQEALEQFDEADDDLEDQAKAILQEMVHESGGRKYEVSRDECKSDDDDGG